MIEPETSQARDDLILAIAHPAGDARNLGPRPWECGPCERADRARAEREAKHDG